MISLKELIHKRKRSQPTQSENSRFGFFHRYISASLIFVLFLSQTVQVSFFDRADANADDYRDIVSLIVDEDTYNQLRPKIRQYAEDIQGYLRATRVNILVTPADIRPEVIAAHNEKLYYEGDGKAGISSLVGTILIGNVPLPIVHKEGISVPSLYPYVDFEDKRFTYNEKEKKYLFQRDAPESSDVEVWHGVINPSLGTPWQKAVHIPKISDFLDKTHEFYTKSGKFTPSTVPPRVFYYDGYNESASVDMTNLYKYVLFTQNIENLIYKRWSKYLLGDISLALSQFNTANKGPEDAFAATLSGMAGVDIGDESIDPATLASLPDIQTSRPILSYLKKFHEIINQKTLSDIQKFVYQAGRYNSGTLVRVDQGAIQMSLTDEVAMQRIKEVNDAIEKAIDKKIIDNKYARPIVILDGVYQKSPYVPKDIYNPNTAALPFIEYKNYYFGKPASTITAPDQCSIARGYSGTNPTFGQSVLVEANAGFDVNMTEPHVGSLSGDTAELLNLHKNVAYACFTDTGVPKIESYYGKNSLLRIAGTGIDPNTLFTTMPSGTNLTKFSKPIFSLGGMKETNRLPNPSINDCLSPTYQYTLLQPHVYSYIINDSWSYNGGTYTCEGAYPDEWSRPGSYCTKDKLTNNPRFTCLTQHNFGPSGTSLKSAVADYGNACVYGTISIDGKYYDGGAGLGGGAKYFGAQCITYGDAYLGTPDIDTTIYKNYAYHTIPSMMKHVSPTPDEINAAEQNGATPSLPIDIIRYVEFLTPKSGRARFNYPNLFDAPSTSIADMRAWLKNVSDTQWNTIVTQEAGLPFPQKDKDINTALGVGAVTLPAASPFDWNTLITDDVLEKVIQAKRWLSPNVTKKYQSLLESNLSYSHLLGADPLNNLPITSSLTNGYDIAYLGLTPFVPGGEKDPNDEELQAYQYSLGEIQGLNFADERDTALDDPASRPTAQCGPPDGVPLFQWPQAILCWIKTLAPPRITGGSCGGNSIGIGQSRPTVLPPSAISRDVPKLKDYYTQGKLVYEIPRTSFSRQSSLELNYKLDRDGAIVVPPPGASLRLDIISVLSGGVALPADQHDSVIGISTKVAPYGEAGADFLLSSYDTLATVTLKPTLSILLPDSTYIDIPGDPLIIRITDEYLELTPTIDSIPVAHVDATEPLPVMVKFETKKGSSGSLISNTVPYTIDIYDDLNGALIQSGIVANSDSFQFPESYKQTLGVYRIIATDATGRSGETTIAIRSGPLARMEFRPISSTLARGSSSLGILRLLDARGNTISPTLFSLKVSVDSGYLIDSKGTKVSSLSLDTIESEVVLSYGSDTVGDMKFLFEIADPAISSNETLRIIEMPRIQLSRSAVPKVGGDPVDIRIDVLDAVTGNLINGFDSVVSLSLPEGAGTFSGSEFPIVNGQTALFSFVPGKKAGDHVLSIVIPGIGTTTSKNFNILPGVPMYIDGNITDTTIDFFLRDRYGNLSNQSLPGTLKNDSFAPQNINFVGGKLSIPRSPGYWRIEVPSLETNTLTYTDNVNTQTSTGVTTTSVPKTIKGIPFFNLYVNDTVGNYKFLSDYNARYTVLAGDSFLREGSQILYDTAPGKSQSLAVSTLLSSPYLKDNLFSLFPGGGWSLGEPSDMALSPKLSSLGDRLRLEISDKASQSPIAQVAYPMAGLPFATCTESGSETNNCSLPTNNGGVTFVLFPESDYRFEKDGASMSIIDDITPRVSYTQTDGISLPLGVELVPRPEYSFGRLVADIEDSGELIGRIIVGYGDLDGVALGDITLPLAKLTLDQDHAFSRSEVYGQTFTQNSKGYSVYRESPDILLEERILGPGHMDSLGSLRELPGVGWQGNNRSLLSFAAGDIVGDATKWFHTYTFVNLGDPVAHVDKGAPGTTFEGIDRTIGTQIAGSSQRGIVSYKSKDMNADGLDDLIVIYDDGFLELHLNMGGTFRRKQMIAYLPEITSRGVDFGDFVGDRYADLISLDHSGSLMLIDNTGRRLAEKPITINGVSQILTRITQYQIFDMDNDSRDDIVYLTEGGELAILYGTLTAGVFDRVILDQKLGVALSGDPEKAGGALRASTTPSSLLPTPTGTGADTAVLNDEVFYQRRIDELATTASINIDPTLPTSTYLTSFPDTNAPPTPSPPPKIYVRSEYALAYGIDVEKRYKNITSSILHGGDRIQVEVSLKNTSANTISSIEYLDTIPKIFSLPQDATYKTILGAQSTDSPIENLAGEDFDFGMRGPNIPAGQTLILTYELEALPVNYGSMIVDRLEGGQVGDDLYGDVGFETSNTCGADMMIWASIAVRSYSRGTRSFDPAELPPSLIGKLKDANGNGIPDSVENMTPAELKTQYNTIGNTSSLSKGSLVKANVNPSGNIISIGLSPGAEQEIDSIAKSLADGMACGFGGGGCLSMPINWAPLAPGGDPVVLGQPVGDGLKVDEGLPIFSALTCLPLPIPKPCGTSMCPATMGIPAVWPVSPYRYEKSSWEYGVINFRACGTSGDLGAGGMLGINGSKNTVRIFVTPTLTLGMGVAVCMGPAKGSNNPFFPLIAKGNCIVMTKPLPVCKGDGSDADGDVSGISGLGSSTDAWNGKSCTMKVETLTKAENTTMTSDIVSYLKNPQTAKLNTIYSNISKRGGRGIDLGGPVVTIGDGSAAGTVIDISLDTSKPLASHNIIKANNRRISGFPEFIMDWVSRQTNEFTNKFLTLPNIIIIPPRSFGQNAVVDGSYEDFLKRFSQSSMENGFKDLQNKIGTAGNIDATKSLINRTRSSSDISKSYENWMDQKVKDNASTINSVAGGANQIRAVYQFIGQLPLIRIEQATVPINIPWPLPQELDRYARSIAQYKNEIARAQSSWCAGKTAQECADIKTSMGLGGLSSGIDKNLKRIEEWRQFPDKIQKYITWKQRYIAQILCNVDAVEQMIGGWYRDNGLRFKKWAEFYVLMKTIVQTWQPFLDLWREKDRSCSVCQNQRWDLKYFRFKALSAVIPQFPILEFPRWPDIILDLSDVRFAILIRVPDFRFNLSPIRLPDLPSLGLPGLPSLSIGLPNLPTLPPVPNLPNLPDLPSLPRIALPNLPPPPKLPKLFGAVSVALNIFKLYTKIQCYMEKTSLIPEDHVGATIAQRTDRQATLSFDFLKVQFPQIAISGIQEIRVSTHINFELKSDFIVEFARNAVKPINRFNADLTKTPGKIGPDIKISTPPNINKKIPFLDRVDETLAQIEQELQKELVSISERPNEVMEVDDFALYLRKELVLAGLDATKLDRDLKKAAIEADALTENMRKESEKGFTLIRKYLKAQEAETREVEKMLDRMKNPPSLLSATDLPLAQMITDTPKVSDGILKKYDAWQMKSQEKVTASLSQKNSFDTQIASIRGQVDRLMISAAPATPAIPSDAGTAVGYNPNYQGIFILTPLTKTQTRLFDYTDPLGEDEQADVIDIDKDGDSDYIFLLDGMLYVKYSSLKEPVRKNETDITVSSPDLTLLPRAPDFFHESIASPGQIELTFAGANPEDKNFRLEFFDKYLEWDRVKLSGGDDPATPRVIIDMTVVDAPSAATGVSTSPVLRSLESVSSPAGFILEGMKVTMLTSPQPFSLSAGRAIYTGNAPATLKYTDPTLNTDVNVSLDRFTKYVFSDSLSGTIMSGKVYVLTPSGSEKLEYNDDMRGMPLLPDTRIIHPNGTVVIHDPVVGLSTALLPNTEYRHISLGRVAPSYTANLTFANGFYSAKLRSLTDDRSIHAGVTLIAPQASLDRSSPVVNIPSRIRVPVYQKESILIADIITDMSPFTLGIDPDISLDDDNNGIFDDDFVTSGSGISITSNDIIFGPYDTLGPRIMNMSVVDDYGNATIEPVQIEVYAPIPKIQTVSSSGSFLGVLDEEISGEPVHLFRIREGEGISIIDPNPYMTKLVGEFSGSNLFAGTGITLKYLAGTAEISPRTGLPFNAANIGSVFIPASSTGTMQIRFADNAGNPLFFYEILPPPTIQIVPALPPGISEDPYLVISLPLPTFSQVSASLSDPSIPGGVYIVGADTKALLAVDRYAQIYILDSSVTLSPIEKDGYLQIRALQGGKIIAEFLYRVDFFLTGK